jgi:LL-diaminopimelate aminotransferase
MVGAVPGRSLFGHMSTPQTSKRARTEPSARVEAMPPYMFAELERKVAEKRQAGIDVISLGIGDPDTPTFSYIVDAMREAVGDTGAQKYPTNRGREEFRQAFADFYGQRFGVEIDPGDEVMPAIGAKECIYHLCFAFLDRGDVALAADPGYPVYTGGPVLAGAELELLPLVPSLGFVPDLDAIPADRLEAARLLFVNYPNNPTGAVVPDGFFERVVELAREHEFLVVHDNAYSETTYDGYVAPSFLETRGAKEVGVEVFSLSKGFNMTGWRCAAILGNADAIKTYWRLKTNVDSGLFEAVQLAGAAALRGPRKHVEEMCSIYQRRRDLVVDALGAIGVEVEPPKGTIYVWAPVPEGDTSVSFAERVLEEAAVVVSPGSMYGPSGEGFFRISLTTPDELIREAVERLRSQMT